MAFTWTDERIAQLRTLHADGLSFGQIGGELGCTRNAAICKAARIGLEKRSHAANGYQSSRPRPQRRRPWKPLPDAAELHPGTAELIALADQPRNPVTFAGLQSQHCRWPIGDPLSSDFVFCGADKLDGLSYCARHCSIAYHAAPRVSEAERELRARRAREHNKQSALDQTKTTKAA